MSRKAVGLWSVVLVAGAISAGAAFEARRAPRGANGPSLLVMVTNEVRARDRRCGCQGASAALAENTKKVEIPVCSCKSGAASFAEVVRQLPDLGAIPERSALLARLEAQEGPCLSLDTGDLLFPHLDVDEIDRPDARKRADLLVELYDILGVAAYTPGEIDLALGRKTLVEVLGRAHFATVAANLVDANTHERLFPARAIVPAKGSKTRVGVVGLFAPPEGESLRDLLARESLAALDPAAALAPEVQALRAEGADLVVLLAHAPEPLVRELVGRVDGIDLAFASHAEAAGEKRAHGFVQGHTAIGVALRGGGAPVLARVDLVPGGRGVVDGHAALEARAWLSRLQGQLASLSTERGRTADDAARKSLDERIASTRSEIERVEATLPHEPRHDVRLIAVPLEARELREGRDPRVQAAIDRFKGEIETLALPSDVATRVEKPGEGPDGKLVAFRTEVECAQCHVRQARVWEKSPHARAWVSLVKAHDERDPDCVRCHSIGFRAPGGFADVKRVVRPREKDSPSSFDFRNVQCEACHGPRAAHPDPSRALVGIHIPALDTCKKCHDPEHDPYFSSERLDKARAAGTVICTRGI
jgi:hypothetical protein